MRRSVLMTGTVIAAGVALAAAAATVDATKGVRPGRWKQVAGDDYDPADPTLLCLAGQAPVLGPTRRTCPGLKMSYAPGRVQVDGVCQIRRAQMTVHGVATGDFQIAYKTDVTVDLLPHPGAAIQHHHTHAEYRWVGACGAGERADDR